jgi:HEPN domain-containing protein
MSDEKRKQEGLRWLATAKNDYDAAIILKEHGKFSLACFHAQQTAEKAIKSLFYSIEEEPWGHSISKLLQQLIKKYPKYKAALSPLESAARRLDQFYIPTRYPNGVPDITPEEAYGTEDAQTGIAYAEKFLKTVKKIYSNL